jgi:hypothetical protein
MLVQLTNAGAALLNANTGPITLTAFKLGSAFGYIPEPTDTNIHGSLIYSGVPSSPIAANANIVKYSAYLDYNLGPFTFGELGLFTSTGVLFALATGSEAIQKIQLTSGDPGNSIRIDVYLSMVNQNYEMWLDMAESNNEFRLAVLGSVDQLPPPQSATPNAYIISGASSSQSSFMAYTDRLGLWNFDAYAYANQATATIVGFDFQSVTIALSDYVPGMTPAYLGAIILEFVTGALYGICRYVQTAVISGGLVTLGFDNVLSMTPIVGDKFTVFGRQSLSTTIPNLPIATTTTLGAVIIGNTLTVDGTGLINIAPITFPVTSVNEMTGDVILTAADITGFATVAISGLYSDLSGKPAAYALPIATTTVLGGVKAPSDTNITIAGDGTIDLGFTPVKSVNGQLPDAGTGNVTISIPAPTVIGLVTPTQVAASTDLNTLQTTGLFFVLDANAPTLVNAPGASSGRPGGTIEVEPLTTTANGGDVIQRYQQAGTLYFRRFSLSGNTWTAWAQALSSALIGVPGGIAKLNQATAPVPATDPYTFSRVPFYENTLGSWWNAGTWDANANNITLTGQVHAITGQKLLAGGLQTIDIAYDGQYPAGGTSPNLQTVSGEGMVYQVSIGGATGLDGVTTWSVGDLAICIQGKWAKIASGVSVSAFNNRTGNVTLTGADITTAGGAIQTSVDAEVAASKYYDVPGGSPGVLTASQIILQHVAVRTITFQVNLAGSQGTATATATAAAVFTIAVNGTTVGTMSFAAGSAVPTFTTTGGTTFVVNAGQVMKVTAPGTADATLANVSFTLLGLAT